METGRTYSATDMARIYCEKCNGCGGCCHGMTDTIHLDPYDVDQLAKGLDKVPKDLIGHEIAFHEDHGMILPHLAMVPDKNWRKAVPSQCGPALTAEENPGVCPFLGADGRCTIHAFRPGFCRLFPLGRDYDITQHSFRYFIVDNGCPVPGKMKVRISQWIGIPDLPRYERYISDWHYFCRDVQERIAASQDPDKTGQHAATGSFAQQLDAFILQVFYLVPYDPDKDFYDLFYMRLQQARSVLW